VETSYVHCALHQFCIHSSASNPPPCLRYLQYSDFKWNFNHFTGVDYDDNTGKKAIFRIHGDGKNWAQAVDKEDGNYDYLSAFLKLLLCIFQLIYILLMYVVGADIDHSHPEARADLIKWGKWVIDEIGAAGFRFDAVKVRYPFSPSSAFPSPDFSCRLSFAYAINAYVILLSVRRCTAHRQNLHCRLCQISPQGDKRAKDVRRRRVLERLHRGPRSVFTSA
jgi:hypothetical protein